MTNSHNMRYRKQSQAEPQSLGILNLQVPSDPRLIDYQNLNRASMERILVRGAQAGGSSRGIWVQSKEDKSIVNPWLLDLADGLQPVTFPDNKKIAGNYKLYIIGHGSPGGSFLKGSRGTWSYEQLAELISNNIISGASLRISLIACHGGSDSKHEKSFAEKLFNSLSIKCQAKGIKLTALEIVGRTGNVARRTLTSDHNVIDSRRKVEGNMRAFTLKGHGLISYKDDEEGAFALYATEPRLIEEEKKSISISTSIVEEKKHISKKPNPHFLSDRPHGLSARLPQATFGAAGLGSATALGIVGGMAATNATTLGTSFAATSTLAVCTAIPIVGWIGILALSATYAVFELGKNQARKNLEKMHPDDLKELRLNNNTLDLKCLVGSQLAIGGTIALAVLTSIPVFGWALLIAAATVVALKAAYEYGKRSQNNLFFTQMAKTETLASTPHQTLPTSNCNRSFHS